MFRHVRERLRDHVVPGQFDGLRQPPVARVPLDLYRYRRSPRQLRDARAEPALDEDAGMDALAQAAQLVHRRGQARPGLGQRGARRRVAGQPRLCDAQRERHRHQALLRAVVQVSLDAPPLGGAEPRGEAFQLVTGQESERHGRERGREHHPQRQREVGRQPAAGEIADQRRARHQRGAPDDATAGAGTRPGRRGRTTSPRPG
ncbi:hypothetical protein V6V89_31185 [Micromonospora sp. CPCC 206061]